MPWIEAGFIEPSHELAERLARAVARHGWTSSSASKARSTPTRRSRSARTRRCRSAAGSRRRARSAPPIGSLAAIGIPQAGVGRAVLLAPERAARGFTAKPHVRRSGAALRALAIVPAFNEEDVIEHVVRDLIENGLRGRAARQRVDRPHRRARPQGRRRRRDVRERRLHAASAQLERFEQIAAERDHDWALVCDADEFRESPWPGMTLIEALREVDALGYSAVNFEVFNFRPTDDAFVPGTRRARAPDALRAARGLRRDPDQVLAEPRLRASTSPSFFGEGARFPNRRVFPVPFILRHYPIRGETHGRTQGARRAAAALRRGRARRRLARAVQRLRRRRDVVPVGSGRPARVGRRRGARRPARARLARGAARPGRARLRGGAHRRSTSARWARGSAARSAGRPSAPTRPRPRCASPSRCRARSTPARCRTSSPPRGCSPARRA